MCSMGKVFMDQVARWFFGIAAAALLLYAGMTFHSTRTRLTEAREELKVRLAAQQVLRLENEALSRQIAVVEAEDIGE